MIGLRWQLPDAPLRTSVITANACGLVAVIALGSMTRAGLHLGQLCVVQLVGLSLTIVPVIPTPLSTVLAAITLTALCYSFLVDVVWLTGAARGGRADLVAGADARQPTSC